MALILFLILFLIIVGQSCVLLLSLFRTRQRTHKLTDEVQHLRNEAQSFRNETQSFRNETQDLTNEVQNLQLSLNKLRNRLDESDGKNEEDRKALRLLMISDLHNDIDALDKKGSLDNELRILLDRVRENISKAEDVPKKSFQ
jgi:predicted  nucleic acid-binding Zn-ribbon protein